MLGGGGEGEEEGGGGEGGRWRQVMDRKCSRREANKVERGGGGQGEIIASNKKWKDKVWRGGGGEGGDISFHVFSPLMEPGGTYCRESSPIILRPLRRGFAPGCLK